MPSTKTKKTARASAKPLSKKRSPRKSAAKRPAKRRSVKKAEIELPLLTQVPESPKPEPVQDMPTMDTLPEEGTAQPPEDTADEVVPVMSEASVSLVRSRFSFYMGVLAGAAILHVLVFALVAIVTA